LPRLPLPASLVDRSKQKDRWLYVGLMMNGLESVKLELAEFAGKEANIHPNHAIDEPLLYLQVFRLRFIDDLASFLTGEPPTKHITLDPELTAFGQLLSALGTLC